MEGHIENIQEVQSKGNLNFFVLKYLSVKCLFKDKECFFCHRRDTLQKCTNRERRIVLFKGKPTQLNKLNPMKMKYLTCIIKESLEGKKHSM